MNSESILFPSGEMIREEGRAARCGASGNTLSVRPDIAGIRQMETQGSLFYPCSFSENRFTLFRKHSNGTGAFVTGHLRQFLREVF